jgi:hypothetical protein
MFWRATRLVEFVLQRSESDPVEQDRFRILEAFPHTGSKRR